MEKTRHKIVIPMLILAFGLLIAGPVSRVSALEVSEPIQHDAEEWSVTVGSAYGEIFEVEVDPSGDSYYALGADDGEYYIAKFDTDGYLIWAKNFTNFPELIIKGLVVSKEQAGSRLYMLMSYMIPVSGDFPDQPEVFLTILNANTGGLIDKKVMNHLGSDFRFNSQVFFDFHSNQHDRLFIQYTTFDGDRYTTRICEYNTTLLTQTWDYQIPVLGTSEYGAGIFYALSENALFCGVNYSPDDLPNHQKAKIWKFAPAAGSSKIIADIFVPGYNYSIEAMTVDNGHVMVLMKPWERVDGGPWDNFYFKGFRSYDYDLIPEYTDPDSGVDLSFWLCPYIYGYQVKKIISQDLGHKIYMIAYSEEHFYSTIYSGHIADPEAVILEYRFDPVNHTFAMNDAHVFGDIQQDFKFYDFEVIQEDFIIGGSFRLDPGNSDSRRGLLTKFPICIPDELNPEPLRPFWNEDLSGFILQNSGPLAVTGGVGAVIGGAVIGGITKVRRKK